MMNNDFRDYLLKEGIKFNLLVDLKAYGIDVNLLLDDYYRKFKKLNRKQKLEKIFEDEIKNNKF